MRDLEFAPESDHIVCERVYFDQMTIVEQLLGEDGADQSLTS